MIGWPGVTSAAPASQWAGRYILFFVLWMQDVTAQANIKTAVTERGVEEPLRTPTLPVRLVTGVAGVPAQLPCLLEQGHHADAPVLVLWYKDGARFPFYTLDLREANEEQEYVDSSVKGRVRSDVTGAHLTFDPLQGHDSGGYRCRVDFEVSPTLFVLVNLTVYVVPSRLVVLDQDDRPVPAGRLGPLTEGDSLSLACVATGGRPAPQVTWWRGSTLLANRSTVLAHSGPPTTSSHDLVTSPSVGVGVRQVRTEVSIPALTRDYLHTNLSCRASNNNITEPLSTTLALLLYLRPTTVSISTPGSPLVEGQEARLECLALGAYPSAVLTWTLTPTGAEHPITLPSMLRQVGQRTSSYTRVTPAAEDHLATLTCAAHNPNITGPPITTSTLIHVLFAPRVGLQLGAPLRAAPITEGTDVYFECKVVANPPAREVVWRKDGQRVSSHQRSGVLVSGHNLVMQGVRRTSAGNYTCTATNTIAASTSNLLHLQIRYQPVCVGAPQTVAVAEGENTRLTCRVDAQPSDALSFTWFFNNTLDTIQVEKDRVTVLGGLSMLDYTPRSPRDYGTLSCWATNTVGTQADPCRFTVIEAGPPERVGNCVLVNLTINSLEVGCTPGNDGGLQQRFVARVYAAPTHTLLATLQEDHSPRFQVGGLTPGQDYLIAITAVNAKGASQPQQINAVRLKVAEKRMGEVATPPVSPLVGVFLGLVGGFVLLLLAGVLLSRARSNRCRCLGERGGERDVVTSGSSPTTTTTPSSAHALTFHSEKERAAPDVLRTINAELLDTRICPEIIPPRVPPPPYSRTQTQQQQQQQQQQGLLRGTLQVTPLAAAAASGTGRALYRDTPSPLHLLHEESFV